MAIQVVMFDLGGVLIELKGLPIEQTKTDLDAKTIMTRWPDSQAVRKFESGRSTPELFAAEMIEEFSINTSIAEFIAHFRQWPRGLFEGAEELLISIADHCHLACLSNTNSLHWDRFQTEASYLGRFHTSLPSHETGHMKPDALAFVNALEKLDIAAEKVLFLDDSKANIKAAKHLGIKAELTLGVQQATQHIQNYGLL